MKHFSLNEYYKNPTRKIVTREGNPARIVCTDADDDRLPILALVFNEDGSTHSLTYTKYGLRSDNGESSLDLFFEPIKKEGWVNIYKDDYNVRAIGCLHSSEEEAIKNKDRNYITTVKVEWEE